MKISAIEAKKYGLGQQIHSAWTYWGHSGCPLISVQNTNDRGDNNCQKVQIVGVHNSWDDRNGNRHGVSLCNLRYFTSRWIK